MMGPAPTVESAHSMVEKAQGTEVKAAELTTATATPSGTATVTPPRRPGHRGADVRDTVAEMAARAQEISLEAGSKIAAAMKDVIGAAAGLTGFALESARDLVQYMVRRGQMTQDEADKLLREVEGSQGPRRPAPPAARPPQPRAGEIIRAEPPRVEAPRVDPDGKKHVAAPAARPVPKSAPKAATKPARPAKKAAAARSAARAKPAAAKKSAAKAKKKR